MALILAPLTLGAASAPAPDRPGPDFDVLDYEVSLTPDLETGKVSGEERITLRSLRGNLGEAVFTGNALDVSAAGGMAASAERRDGAWVVRFKKPLGKGRQAVLSLRFSGAPKRGLVVGPRHIHTDYFACDWMICTQDRPGDKATLTLRLNLNPALSVIGPGKQVRDATASVWRLEKPYSSYLYGFAAGVFTFADDPAHHLTYATDARDQDRVLAARPETDRMAAFFAAKAGLPLPAGSYLELVVDGSAAQESATYSTLGWADLEPLLDSPQEDWLPAHELAHQWWGNLVTCASWDDFWLNEGVTSFMVAAWKEHRWGRAAYDREMALFQARVDKATAAGVDVPLTFHGPYPSLGLKRAIVYSKGALFMDALRRGMGEDAFWAGLKRYTRAYAGGAADSHDFQKAMQTETRKDLGPLFDAWVY